VNERSRSGTSLPRLNPSLAKALAHPLRQQLLLQYNERVASPGELADRLGAPLGDVSYHTKRLLALGCIELDRTEPGRGGTRHYYRAVVRYELQSAEYASLAPALRTGFVEPILSTIWRDVDDARTVAGFDDPDMHISHQWLELDDDAWNELSALLEQVVETADRLARESASRRPNAGKRRSTLGVIHVRIDEQDA
jgi:DNA-binding transcriptional ArsR family regulator